MVIIFATIMTLTTPTGSLSPEGSLVYLGVWRIVLGVGVGECFVLSFFYFYFVCMCKDDDSMMIA